MSKLDAQATREAQLDAVLDALGGSVPYNRFLGVGFERLGDELTAKLHYAAPLIGNPILPALHGGVTGAFLEIAAITQLAWDRALEIMDAGGEEAEKVARGEFTAWPRTVDISIDYLRSGRARDTYARAQVVKAGRRVANVRVEAWQSERARPIAVLHGHFLMPQE